jgi:hypothetical protein
MTGVPFVDILLAGLVEVLFAEDQISFLKQCCMTQVLFV